MMRHSSLLELATAVAGSMEVCMFASQLLGGAAFCAYVLGEFFGVVLSCSL